MKRLLTDIAGPFFEPGQPFRNCSALPYYQLDLPQRPYVNRERLERGLARAERYLAAVAAQGYTGIVLDNLAHLITFDAAQERIYAPNDPCRQRALIYGEAFMSLLEQAAGYGMEIFIATDMQWATPALRRYARRLEAGNARLAAANRWALEELFTRFPTVSGLFVRVGETGGAHNQGTEYTGHLLYRTASALRWLIDALLPVCEQHRRLLVVRTWSIGIGELGDLLWSPERYWSVFGTYRSPYLLASIKHGPSDFFRHLPPNPTLGLPGPAQLVELQNRREYELFGMAPCGVAKLHGEVLAITRRLEGVAGAWVWNSSGGWGGGQAGLGQDGWSLWTELSSAVTAAMARGAADDVAAFTRAWCLARFAPDGAAPDQSAFAEAVAAVYLDSEQVIEDGWYCGPLRREATRIGDVVLPTLLWIWWMRPTGAPVMWALLAETVPDIRACLERSRSALMRLEEHYRRLLSLAPNGVAEAITVVESVRYLRDCLEVALALRKTLLPAFSAARVGDRAGWSVALQGLPVALDTLARHEATWGGRSDFPALELEEIAAYLTWLRRAPAAGWLQARLACRLVRHLVKGWPRGAHLRAMGAGIVALLMIGLWRHPRAWPALAGVLAAGALAAPFRRPVVQAALPWLSRRFFLLPSIFFEAGPSCAEWTG
ncbi:MAG: hypothetical protein RMK84_15055 [Oscillochloridaceae bacterium]|nr:hypothetical protein [Chloroflexaceae bacterium]MDW8391441.1 hypothetical protein [Oscillochloridaceae bacterium]